jgi:NADPH:quinone reductase
MSSEQLEGVRGRAVRLDRYGDRDVLYVAEVGVAPPGDGEVLVGVRAAGINPGEAAIRTGALHEQWPATFPSGQGSDLAGVVAAVGAGVADFAVGDEVLGWSWQRSSHAEFVVVPATQLIPKPAGLSWEAAGALYVVGATAYAAARAVGSGSGSGDTVVVSAATGGVGTVLVQLLRVRGARVLGIASETHHAWLRNHGVEPVAYGEVLAEMASLVADGQIDLPVAATYPLERVRDAFAELEQRHTLGKIVLVSDCSQTVGDHQGGPR